MVACICHSPLYHQKPDFEGQSVIKASSYLLPFVLEAHRESLPRSCETSACRLSAESAEVYSTADLPASAAHIPFSKYVPTSFDQQFQVSQGHTSYKNKENRNTEVHGGGGLELVKPAREPASSRPKPCASLKKPHEPCSFAAPCGPRRKKNDRGQRSAFLLETSRFALSILAHRGSALPWLVNDRATLRLRRI